MIEFIAGLAIGIILMLIVGIILIYRESQRRWMSFIDDKDVWE